MCSAIHGKDGKPTYAESNEDVCRLASSDMRAFVGALRGEGWLIPIPNESKYVAAFLPSGSKWRGFRRHEPRGEYEDGWMDEDDEEEEY